MPLTYSSYLRIHPVLPSIVAGVSIEIGHPATPRSPPVRCAQTSHGAEPPSAASERW